MTKLKVAGVVILYNSEDDIINNIDTYICELDKLYILDNSDKKILDKKLLDQLKNNDKVIYINNIHNKGVSYSLNLACSLALKNGYKWILTMDQDSKFVSFNLDTFKKLLKDLNDEKVGIISANQISEEEFLQNKLSNMTDAFKIVDFTWTSGNLLNLDAFNEVGEFDENLFIDEVDHEFCLRLRKNNYKIIKVYNFILLHKLGNTSFHNFLWKKNISVSHHNYIRRYYMTRNRFYLMKKHKQHFPEIVNIMLNNLFYDFIKIMLFEEQKIKKTLSIMIGINDFIRQKYGKVL